MPRFVARLGHKRARGAHAFLLIALLVGLLAGLPGAVAAQDRDDDGGVATLTGEVSLTDPSDLTYMTEPFVLLNDLTNFVEREFDAPLPDFIQVTAAVDGELDGATYTLPLPIAPQATINDVDQGQGGDGVQVYSVDLWVNFVGDPFVDPIEGGGWSSSWTSAKVAVGTSEIVGGKLVIWAPDDEQAFPTGFGDDGLLFTEDDPVDDVLAGWTVVDLDAEPFALERDPTADVTIIEGYDGLVSYSELSYTAAFDALVEDLRLRYPFTDFKGLDWDDLVGEFRPRIEDAEEADDLVAFHVAIMEFTVAIGDGHVGVEPNIEYVFDRFGGGAGLTLGETDEGEVVVAGVVEDSEADDAGLEPGVEVVAWNGDEIGDAIGSTALLFPVSSPHTARLQQLALLPRGEHGDEIEFTYRDEDGDEETVELALDRDVDGLIALFAADYDPAEMPVTVEILPSGHGYVRVNTFLDDIVLMTHAWDWALTRLAEYEVPGLIVDVRSNGGGYGAVATYFAGSFYDEEVELAELLYATDVGEFLTTGTFTIAPSDVQWDGPVAVLIDEQCASACEIFSAAMSLDSDHLIVGQYPTAGVEASIYPWLLPGDLDFQAPLGYMEVDGEVWIEGVGVPPTVDVPVTVDSLTGEDDVVLEAAEDALS